MHESRTRCPVSSTRKPPSNSVSRRDFLAATAASGIGLGMGQSAAAAPQRAVDVKPENALPKDEPVMFRGTASGAVLAQLRAANVHTLFHTNTSGFVPFWEAIYAAATCKSST